VLIDEDRIAIGVNSDEAGRPGYTLVAAAAAAFHCHSPFVVTLGNRWPVWRATMMS